MFMGYSEEAYKDPDVLRKLYHGEDMTLQEVGDKLGVAFTTVQKWMEKHDIPRREYGSLEQRFELYYEVDEESGCWEWKNSLDEWGHGRIYIGHEARYAHRVAYELEHGEIPDGKQINHGCRNASCVNPDHLYAGTQQENVQDETDAGVWTDSRPRGSQVGTSSLTESDVAEIKALWEMGGHTQREIAERYETVQQNVSRIVNGLRWTHVDPAESV